MIIRIVPTPFVHNPSLRHLRPLIRAAKAKDKYNGKNTDAKPPRITSNVKGNLRVIKHSKEFELRRSGIPKPTTRYRKKKDKREEHPSDDEEVYESPIPKLYDTKEDFKIGVSVLLVDGYNVCGYWPKLKKLFSKGRLREARQELVDELLLFSATRGVKVVVVYDARMSGRPTHKETFFDVDIVFSADSSADAWIEREVRALRADGCPRVRVVTSDRCHQHTAHGLGAYVWSCRAFISEINDSKNEYEEFLLKYRKSSMQGSFLANDLKPEVVASLKELKRKLEEAERSQTRHGSL